MDLKTQRHIAYLMTKPTLKTTRYSKRIKGLMYFPKCIIVKMKPPLITKMFASQYIAITFEHGQARKGTLWRHTPKASSYTTRRRTKRGENPDYVAQSVLAQFLLTMFTWGEFSPPRIQFLTQLALSDFRAAQTIKAIVDDLHVLANSGSGGKYANQMHVDLLKKNSILASCLSPSISRPLSKNHMVNNLKLRYCRMRCSLQLLKVTVKPGIYPGESKLLAFWETAQNHPLMKDHTVREQEEWTNIAYHLVCTGTAYQRSVWEKLGAKFCMCSASFH